MRRNELQLFASALVSLGASVVSLVVLPWFWIRITLVGDLTGMGVPAANAQAMLQATKFEVGLRTVASCSNGGCVTGSFDRFPGAYPTIAQFTFWASVVLCIAIAWQTFQRLFGGGASSGVSRTGYLIATAVLVGAVVSGFVVQPETGENAMVSVVAVRTWAPALLILGSLAGMYALYLAPMTDFSSGPHDSSPVRTQAPVVPTQRIAAAKTRVPDSISLEVPPASLPASARAMVGVVRYATSRATIGDAGIVVEHEDGTPRRVLWPAIVGVIARRLPNEAPYNSETFVDIVSTPGATVRIVGWTELSISGELETKTGVERARSLAEMIAARCPAVQLDAATREFVTTRNEAPQIPDAATLAQYDARLA